MGTETRLNAATPVSWHPCRSKDLYPQQVLTEWGVSANDFDLTYTVLLPALTHEAALNQSRDMPFIVPRTTAAFYARTHGSTLHLMQVQVRTAFVPIRSATACPTWCE